MSITLLPRELGIILRCNGTTEDSTCRATLATGQILAGSIRSFAKSQKWGRGLRKGRKRCDLCPTCMPVEAALHKKQKADWEAEKTRRGELRKAKFSSTPRPKRSRKKPAAPASSPSAESAPAHAT